MIFILSLLLSVSPVFADSKHDSDVKECLSHWGSAPFDAKNLKYRTIETSVSVFGAGSDIIDEKQSSGPELIFIKPSVNVLGKSTIKLLNPNGWYCMKSNTNVLGKAIIELHCKAKMSISNTGATVLGSDQGDQKGNTVLGKTKIKRVGC